MQNDIKGESDLKVLIMSNIPSPYRVNFYNELGKRCDLTVLFETDSSTERDASWKKFEFTNFNGRILKGIRTGMDSAFCPEIVHYLNKQYDVILVGGVASLTPQLAVTVLRSRKIPYLYEGDGGIVSKTTGWKAWLKRRVLKYAKYCMSTTDDFDKYCIAYGAEKQNLRRYPFTSIYKKDVLQEPLSDIGKLSLRRELGITAAHMIVSVGRPVKIKGFDLLQEAFAELPGKWELYIIGGESAEDRGRIHFIPFQEWNKLKKYYCAADYFVLPTRYDPWGLVVNEAMACGLPVITTYQCGAGTELVKEGQNGYLYDAEDVGALRDKMIKLCRDTELRKNMGNKSLNVIADYTIEKMADRYLEILEEAGCITFH